jgi:hypothetical protein
MIDPQAPQCTSKLNVFRDVVLVQHTTGATHDKRHTLDMFITQRSTSVCVLVDPTLMSDHSLIVGQIAMNVAKRLAQNLSLRVNGKILTSQI